MMSVTSNSIEEVVELMIKRTLQYCGQRQRIDSDSLTKIIFELFRLRKKES